MTRSLGAHYELLEIIGRGASGTVWKAHDKRTGELVAAKILRPEYVEDPDVVTRFIRERTILTALSGETIVAVRDLVVEGTTLAVVQEFVPGRTLRAVLQETSPLTPFDAASVTIKVLEALEIAHAAHVVHRDVKPDNVMVDEPLFSGLVKLTDFGISSIIAEGNHTSTALIGTPSYMPPELIEFGTTSFAGDVYSTGIMLYELLGGRTPFAGSGTDYTITHRHLTAAPPPLPIDDALWDVVSSMLSKRPKGRPTAAEATDALRELLPTIANLPALEPQPTPETFPEAYGPATILRPNAAGDPPSPSAPQGLDPDSGSEKTDADPLPDVDLSAFGSSPDATVLRQVPVHDTAVNDPKPAQPKKTGKGQRYWIYGVVSTIAAVVIGAGIFAFIQDPTPPASEPFSAHLEEQTLPTGLTISRTAEFNPQTQEIDYTVEYGAATVPLLGPFLESVIGPDTTCPAVRWEEDQQRNLSAETNIAAECGWAINPGPIQPGQVVRVTGHFTPETEHTEETLQAWLESTASATNKALHNPETTSRAYPVQRLSGISAATASRIVTGEPVTINIYPVWPSGIDTLDPIYISPHTGRPTATFEAVAGGEKNLRFIDRCAGAAAVSRSGTEVTALRPALQCSIEVELGDLQSVQTNPFDIVNHGS